METLEIKTNNRWRNFLYGYELTEKEKKEFDWMSEEELDCGSFFRYRKCAYSLSEFMRINREDPCCPFPKPWSGYSSDSYFSGVLIQISEDGEQYKVGRYSS